MPDELDISQEKSVFYEQRARKVIENLQRRKMNGQYAANRREALAAAMAMIPPGAVVARGDSISLEQIGLLEAILERNQNKLLDPFRTEGGPAPKWAPMQKMMVESFSADIYITSSNAITLDGKLVNVDGNGNRVSAMIYGPPKVILVVGANKIVKNVDEALERIHQYAAPLNARRHYLKHDLTRFEDIPCVKTGTCVDCRHDYRICNFTTIIEGAMSRNTGRINVVLVGEDLGI